jgi:hypothetical protein
MCPSPAESGASHLLGVSINASEPLTKLYSPLKCRIFRGIIYVFHRNQFIFTEKRKKQGGGGGNPANQRRSDKGWAPTTPWEALPNGQKIKGAGNKEKKKWNVINMTMKQVAILRSPS